MDSVSCSRRSFLKQVCIGAAGLGLGVNGLAQTKPDPTRRLKDIGLQLLTVAKEIQNDWKGTLKQVAEIGYRNLEFGQPYGDSVETFKIYLKELGLVPFAGGGTLGELKKSGDNIIESSRILGKKWVVCYWPWEGSSENKTLDDWKKMAETLNTVGKKVKAAGLGFAYHNHELEFKTTEGIIPYDIVLKYTDPSLVDMQIDLYWIEKGGQEPASYFEKYPGRFPLWHAKDMNNATERSFACVGQGIIDFPSLFAKADSAGMKAVFVEHDKPKDGIECARLSYDYLKRIRY